MKAVLLGSNGRNIYFPDALCFPKLSLGRFVCTGFFWFNVCRYCKLGFVAQIVFIALLLLLASFASAIQRRVAINTFFSKHRSNVHSSVSVVISFGVHSTRLARRYRRHPRRMARHFFHVCKLAARRGDETQRCWLSSLCSSSPLPLPHPPSFLNALFGREEKTSNALSTREQCGLRNIGIEQRLVACFWFLPH